ncbi:hypothetical protein PNEG_01333 [Pneumocystis murina B123]|uniref:Glutamyl-tRNA amidotransferase complex subunit Gta3 domain-containing protein n=1 Tax=Pneumocystis murina (strain B123) TaxID=1069680 RepID=M7NTM4_PNEMU|nr:hypothetical protein PNEG_01333 [Pneumocystis murina B123]EMR10632.1 hypothetical protein PNEG_01333 [Pneumocystis murina B123]
MYNFFSRFKRAFLGRNSDILVNIQREIKTLKDITEHLDIGIPSTDLLLYYIRNQKVEKLSDKTLKHLCKLSFLSFPKDDKKEKLIEKISMNIDFVKSIKDVDVKYVKRLVSVRKDGPILLTYENLSNKTEEPCEWNVFGLTKNREGNFFVLKKQ